MKHRAVAVVARAGTRFSVRLSSFLLEPSKKAFLGQLEEEHGFRSCHEHVFCFLFGPMGKLPPLEKWTDFDTGRTQGTTSSILPTLPLPGTLHVLREFLLEATGLVRLLSNFPSTKQMNFRSFTHPLCGSKAFEDISDKVGIYLLRIYLSIHPPIKRDLGLQRFERW